MDCHKLALWGLDANGYFISEDNRIVTIDENESDGEEEHGMIGLWKSFRRTIKDTWNDIVAMVKSTTAATLQQTMNIPDRIKADLKEVVEETYREMNHFTTMELSDREKSKRIMFHFQKDLIAGLSGQMLESHDRREEITLKPYSRTLKQCCWGLLTVSNAGMLFYIFLFGVSRDTHHQSAWAKSFATWLVMEIVIMSSVMVLIMNVLMPIMLMKDLGKIKMKLVDTIVQYNRKLRNTQQDILPVVAIECKDDSSIYPSKGSNESLTLFNAAEYLFVSYRLAQSYPELRVSKIILAYETTWPRQSYLHTTETVTQTYDKRFAAIYNAITMIITFVITNFLTFPAHLQDMVVQVVSTIILGYTILLHLQLYQVYPVLIIVPTVIIVIVIHFMIQSAKTQKKVEIMTLLKHTEDVPVPDSTVDVLKRHEWITTHDGTVEVVKPISSMIIGEDSVTLNEANEDIECEEVNGEDVDEVQCQSSILVSDASVSMLSAKQIDDNDEMNDVYEDILEESDSSWKLSEDSSIDGDIVIIPIAPLSDNELSDVHIGNNSAVDNELPMRLDYADDSSDITLSSENSFI